MPGTLLAEKATAAWPAVREPPVALRAGSLLSLFTSGAEGFEAGAADQVGAGREQPVAVFAHEETSGPAAFFVAETCFDSEEEAEGETDWPYEEVAD